MCLPSWACIVGGPVRSIETSVLATRSLRSDLTRPRITLFGTAALIVPVWDAIVNRNPLANLRCVHGRIEY